MSDIAQAKIFFGSTEENKEAQQERMSPFDGAVVINDIPTLHFDVQPYWFKTFRRGIRRP